MSESDDVILAQCQDVIDYRFRDLELLSVSLRHSSASDQRIDSNERLEFLGDAVLDIIICEDLYRRFPQHSEGELTILKSAVVSRRTCAQVAHKLGLHNLLKLGKGITEQNNLPESLAAAVVESIIGAMYIDGGLAPARKFVQLHFEPFIELAQHHHDYKSMFQQYIQSEYGTSPYYELLDEKGPDHSKAFEVAAGFRIAGRTHTFAPAWGVSKKDAEQKAAKLALEKLGVLEESPTPETLDLE